VRDSVDSGMHISCTAPGASVHIWLSSFCGRICLQMLSVRNETLALCKAGEGFADVVLVAPNLHWRIRHSFQRLSDC